MSFTLKSFFFCALLAMAGPEQTIPMTALYLREALRTQSPQAVFVELTGMFYSRCTNYTKTNVGQMPWGYNRLAATFTEAEPEVRAGLLFPLLFYHDRWSELTADDWTVALRGYSRDPLAGYTCMPVCATSFLGIVSASSGSTMATSGVISKSAIGYLMPF